MSTARDRWDKMQSDRQEFLDRAIDASSLTIPSLIPESDYQSSGATLGKPMLESLFQGVGARGVSSLAAKLLLTLLPPTEPFFRFTLDEGKLNQYIQARGVQQPEDFRSRIETQLSQMERQVLQRLNRLRVRPAMFEALKHLVVGGNALIYLGDTSVRTYSLRSFAVERDPEGNPVELVIREHVSEQFLPRPKTPMTEGGKGENPNTEVFTHVKWNYKKDLVEWYQEHEGQQIRRSGGFSTVATSPWMVLRLVRIAGESYGRGLVEEVIGDLSSLNELMRAVVEGNLQISKTIWLVNPNGMTRMDAIANAENGDCVPGSEGDVVPLTAAGKSGDYASALQAASVIERRLQYAFLMTETVQRDAERVTAEEIRVMAQQLDQGMGGYYSLLSDELQLPMVKRLAFLMQRDGELPALPEDLVEPQVTTGIDAIGRGNDKMRLQSFLATVAGNLGPEALLQYINPEELIRRFAAADGIDAAGLVKTAEQLQAEMAQARQASLAEQVASGALSNGVQANAPQGAPPQA